MRFWLFLDISCTSGSSPTRTPSTGSGSDTSDGSTTATPDSTSSTTIHSTTSTVSTTTVSTASSSPAVPSLSSSPTPNNRAATHTNPNTGAIAGGVVGGAVFLACVIVAGILYFRRKRRMAPSAEFMDSVHKGAPPIFRLRSGAEYTASTPDHVGSLPGTPIPFPFMQDPDGLARFQREKVVTSPTASPVFGL
ncbi:hypothetical protein SERLA73DRAFT_185573 [Serpula lacrymans var. lacrymans S7.3]|uniref:Mid2 domain-containing protein n=2 Tax=Serpula lacrymans var. lacrymans TaxID=341189 RepID=F8Q621_SERL3|nr:uncharacterized protein SERLADRAFT_474120 [Serpula lacrymans var. lacrymans S7.9]EGN96059.1 hypothetical protein SERLA73DRAFT_185573 [Serpula lacrymans var. lacrymans S7.3]EGO21582.1 hypothetical protein SERLADRAFT_474120 [Serpula lacrymans var. lacrymans S7.9]